MIPKIGEHITVVVRSGMAPYKHLYADGVITEFLTFSGVVVEGDKWQKNMLCLSTGSRQFPIRSIDMTRIISINGTKNKKMTTIPKNRSWIVKGSKGNSYTVTEENGLRSCTCVGFEFRRQCKHLNMVK